MNKPIVKVLIIGHRQSGKTEIGEELAALMGTKAHDSSWYAAEKIVYPKLKEKYGYVSAIECHADRHQHRKEWFDIIREFNTAPDRLTRHILEDGDIYVGMRSRAEFEGSKHHFDLIVWVDAEGRVPEESKESMELSQSDADYVLYNRGPHDELDEKIHELAAHIGLRWSEA